MKKANIFKRTVSFFTVISMVLSLTVFGSFGANAFDTEYIDNDGMKLGYSIINGYSKLSIKNEQYKNSDKIAVYCGLDITNFYTMAVAGMYYVTKGVDLDRLISDNDYAMEQIEAFDKYLSKAGIKNDRAQQYKSSIIGDSKKVYNSFDTLGLYIFDASDKRAVELMNQEGVDFVLDGGRVPANMKDLNIDGKTDLQDAQLIQQYLAEILKFDDSDEDEYALFVCDINGDKQADIRDASDIMKKYA